MKHKIQVILFIIFSIFWYYNVHWNYDNQYSFNNWEFIDFWPKDKKNENIKILKTDVILSYLDDNNYKYSQNTMYSKLEKVLPIYHYSSEFIDYADARTLNNLNYWFKNLHTYTISNNWNTPENYVLHLYPVSPYWNYLLNNCTQSNKIIILPDYWMKNIESYLEWKQISIRKNYKLEKIEDDIINYSCSNNKVKNNFILYTFYEINMQLLPNETKELAVSYDSLQYFYPNMSKTDKNKFLSSAFWYYFTQEKSDIPIKVEWNIGNNFELLIKKDWFLEKTSRRVFNDLRNIEFQIQEKSKK